MNLIQSNGQLNYKEICGRVKKAAKPFKGRVTYKISTTQLKNTIYVDIISKHHYDRIRISTHDAKDDFEGLSVVLKNQLSGIVQPIRKHINFLLENKIDHKTNHVIKAMYKGQTLKYLTNDQLKNLLVAVNDILDKRTAKAALENVHVDTTPVSPTVVNKSSRKHTNAKKGAENEQFDTSNNGK